MKSFFKKLYAGWMRFAVFLGTVMTTLLCTILFFIVLPPFSLIRLKDPLRLRLDDTDSYWEDYEPAEPTIERFQHPF